MNSSEASRVLIHDAEVVVTMDARRREIPGGSVFVRGNVIESWALANPSSNTWPWISPPLCPFAG
jgi:hypothetical protein